MALAGIANCRSSAPRCGDAPRTLSASSCPNIKRAWPNANAWAAVTAWPGFCKGEGERGLAMGTGETDEDGVLTSWFWQGWSVVMAMRVAKIPPAVAASLTPRRAADQIFVTVSFELGLWDLMFALCCAYSERRVTV